MALTATITKAESAIERTKFFIVVLPLSKRTNSHAQTREYQGKFRCCEDVSSPSLVASPPTWTIEELDACFIVINGAG